VPQIRSTDDEWYHARLFTTQVRNIYLDGVCAYNRPLEERLEHLRLVLQRFEEGLKLSLEKCFFGLHETDCLDYTLSEGKISVSTTKVEDVKDWPFPTTQKEFRSFVQFSNFYAKFLQHVSDLTAPLTYLLQKSEPQMIMMTRACLEAFETLG
jgi:hypothetical protein